MNKIIENGMTALTLDRHKGSDISRLGLNYRIDKMHSVLG